VQIGVVDAYANHGVLVIGNTPELNAGATLQGVAVASASHLLLATRGQAGLVRVRLWDHVGPLVGTEVVAADLELQDGRLFIFDIEKVGIHIFSTGRLGKVPVRALVDDPGTASRVNVLIGGPCEERELTSVEGHPLFSVSIESGTNVEVADELGIILSEHDLPLSRLAAAIKLIGNSPVARPAILESRIDQVVEWSRWLSFSQHIGESRKLRAFLHSEMPSPTRPLQDIEALGLAERMLASFVGSTN
jgi:hypothetical protein